jgi:hypothetical protein
MCKSTVAREETKSGKKTLKWVNSTPGVQETKGSTRRKSINTRRRLATDRRFMSATAHSESVVQRVKKQRDSHDSINVSSGPQVALRAHLLFQVSCRQRSVEGAGHALNYQL